MVRIKSIMIFQILPVHGFLGVMGGPGIVIDSMLGEDAETSPNFSLTKFEQNKFKRPLDLKTQPK